MKAWYPFLLMLCSFALYGESSFPEGCQAVTMQNDAIVLEAKQPTVILIYNNSASNLWLTHPVAEPSASAGWSSQLTAENWSALVLDKSPFAINCIESKPGHEQQVPCEGILTFCEWKGVAIPANLSGSFWAAENMKLPNLTSHLGARGFKLPSLP